MNAVTALRAAVICAAAIALRSATMSSPPAPGGISPALPSPWMPALGRVGSWDLALPRYADAWLRHPILGDPSYDSFTRAAGNPLVRGAPPYAWPVNVSVLHDPLSGNWYAYVGVYPEGYAIGGGAPPSYCHIYRSRDRGQTWEDIGPAFRDPSFRFEGDSETAATAPDVSVVYHDGKYHMAYDWCSEKTTWQNAHAPRDGTDSGVGYAWAERPEGPFHRARRPILRTSEVQRWNHGSSRYRRAYATSLIRRKNDWLVITDLDSGPHFAWGAIVMTAKDPAGKWSEPVMVASLEGDTYYPSPVEGFPAFAYQGYVYDPRTSVGANRNFQVMMRAPIEKAHLPEAWELYQHGSLWHGVLEEHEAYGLWGQTFAGTVDKRGTLHVLYPSRDRAHGYGTINRAWRAWSRPFRTRGFAMSAHTSRSFSCTRFAVKEFALEADLTLRGRARLAWGYQGVLGAEGRADGRPHAMTWTRYTALELSREAWRLLQVGEDGREAEAASGSLDPSDERRIAVKAADATLQLTVDGKPVWEGAWRNEEGALALLLEPWTQVDVTRFRVSGRPGAAEHVWLWSEAISGAGVAEGSYKVVAGREWRFGRGALCETPGERVKWNFRGRGFRLWLPRGPRYGRVEVLLNGRALTALDLHAPTDQASAVVLERRDLPDGYHALVLRGDARPLPVDTLDALQ